MRQNVGTEVRRWIGKPTAPPLEGSLAAATGAEIDEISHVLSRLTFGRAAG
jgi:hypothetical protein